MESKELNEILNKTRRTPNISLTPKQVEELVKDLEQVEFLKRKNDDLWETIKTLSQNAYINKLAVNGIEIKITLNSWQKDFDKIAWVFGCQRR